MYTTGGLSEPGLAGFQDFQDESLGYCSPFQRKTATFCKGTFGHPTHNPENHANPENPGSNNPTFPLTPNTHPATIPHYA